MNFLRLIGLNVQRLRLDRRLTQEQAAFEANIAFNYLSGIERGKHNPSVKVLWRIAKVLRVPITDLFMPLPPGYVPPRNLPRGRKGVKKARPSTKARKR
jgi:transcriptional regulator with XRE-family HTH domain